MTCDQHVIKCDGNLCDTFTNIGYMYYSLLPHVIKCDGTIYPVYPPETERPLPALPVRVPLRGGGVLHGGLHRTVDSTVDIDAKQSTGGRPLQVRMIDYTLLFIMLMCSKVLEMSPCRCETTYY